MATTPTIERCPATAEEKALLQSATLTDPLIQAHGNAFYHAMRHGDPIHYDEKLGMYLVSRYEDIQFIQNDPVTFSVHLGYHTQQAAGFREEFIEILKRDGGGYFPDAIMSDPPYHTRIRRLMESAFTAHRVKELEPRITQVVIDLLDSVADKGSADAVNDIAVPLTIRVICEQLGLPQNLRNEIQRWSMAVTAQIGRMQNREQMIENAQTICELQRFLIEQIKDRQDNPKEDMISDLVHAKDGDGEGSVLNFEEVVSLVRALVIAGNDTTATAITNLFYLLTTQPGLAQLLRDSVDDDRLLTRFVEELLRIEPPVRGLSRMTIKEVNVNGVTLPEHAHLLLLYASGNDDETVFPCPRQFDLNRPNIGRHVTFGGGPHRCVGLSLARMEIKVVARELIRRFDNIKLAVPVEEVKYTPTVATHSIESLPITFDRRA